MKSHLILFVTFGLALLCEADIPKSNGVSGKIEKVQALQQLNVNVSSIKADKLEHTTSEYNQETTVKTLERCIRSDYVIPTWMLPCLSYIQSSDERIDPIEKVIAANSGYLEEDIERIVLSHDIEAVSVIKRADKTSIFDIGTPEWGVNLDTYRLLGHNFEKRGWNTDKLYNAMMSDIMFQLDYKEKYRKPAIHPKSSDE